MSQHEMNMHLRDPIMVRLTSSKFIKNFIIIYFGYLSFLPLFPLFQAFFVYLIISPVPTCLVHNCETSQRFYYFHLLSPLSCDQFPLIPINGRLDNLLQSSRLEKPS